MLFSNSTAKTNEISMSKIYLHSSIDCNIIYNSQIWNQFNCLPVDEWIKKIWYIYTMEYHLAFKKKQKLSFSATWMDWIMCSEINQSQDKYHMISPVCGIWKQLNSWTQTVKRWDSSNVLKKISSVSVMLTLKQWLHNVCRITVCVCGLSIIRLLSHV